MAVKALEKTFEAWINTMPGAKHKLIVTGDVETPTLGWKVALVEARPQGFNPNILILDVVATPPSGGAGDQIDRVEVRFEKPAEEGDYSEVTIRGGNPDFTITVGTAS